MGEKLWYSDNQRQQLENQVRDEGLDDYQAEKADSNLEAENNLPLSLTTTAEIIEKYGEDKAEEIYEWYAKAISRRDREPLERGRFINHFFEKGSFDESYAYGEDGKGYLMGIVKYGVFIPTHFAPRTLRGGVELMERLGADKETPAVMSITPDLVETITKMPEWHKYDMKFLSMFRDNAETKEVVYNESPEVEKLLLGLLQEYIDESKNIEQYSAEEETQEAA